MAFTFQKPTVPRFVHVAAQIFSQVVVTKGLSDRLLKVLHKPNTPFVLPGNANNNWTITDGQLHEEALRVLGIDYDPAFWTNHSFFGIDRCTLVYMAAAVLHPQKEWRAKFVQVLEEGGIHLEKIGQSLVDFIKFFITSLPMTKQRSAVPGSRTTLTGNLFNCMEQGVNMQKIFDKFCGTVAVENRDATPPVYLGPLVPYNECIAAYEALNVANPVNELQNTLLPQFWPAENGQQGVNIDREVRSSDFTGPNPDNPDIARYPGLRGYVFPGSLEEGLKQEDFLAITKSINVQDCLVAFVQIMLKRFFQKDSHLFAETTLDEQGRIHADRPNEKAFGPNAAQNAMTRIALTSNDYPVHKCGQQLRQESNHKWEIVIVRPNIEHNMLGAILGRYVLYLLAFLEFYCILAFYEADA
jgi:hypothetical protein